MDRARGTSRAQHDLGASLKHSLLFIVGNGSAAVNAPEGCDWTATTEDDWIAITGEANGSGNGSVDFTVDANTTASERSGSITVEDPKRPA